VAGIFAPARVLKGTTESDQNKNFDLSGKFLHRLAISFRQS
jgi:hypothetical protein